MDATIECNTNHEMESIEVATTFQLRRAVHMAMDRIVPLEKKQAYLEAMENAPQVVEVESDPAAFLRIDNYCAEAAAHRLAKHWNLRKNLLQERAFKPVLDLSDEGALPKEDRDLLHAGLFLTLLKDSAGRPILLIDEHEVPVSFAEYKRMRARVIFYVQVKCAAENFLSQSDGVRCLRVLRTPVFDLAGFRMLQQITDTAMHMKFYDFIFIGMPPPKGRKHFRQTLLPLIQRVPFNFGYSKIIMGTCRDKMLAALLDEGFCKDQLPPLLGGTWTHEDSGDACVSANQQQYGKESLVGRQERFKKRMLRRQEQAVVVPIQARLIHAVARKDRTTVDHTYRDYSQVPPHPDSRGEPDNVAQMSFVQKVYHMLQAQHLKDYIWWLPHGRAFMLCDPYELEESQLLLRFFGIDRVSIFVLLLGNHGFKRLSAGRDRGAFYHECMLRNLPHLIKFFPAPRDHRVLKSDMENEPCFYSISANFPLPGSSDMEL